MKKINLSLPALVLVAAFANGCASAPQDVVEHKDHVRCDDVTHGDRHVSSVDDGCVESPYLTHQEFISASPLVYRNR